MDIAANKKTNRRIIPTSVAPITFFVREEADWMISHVPDDIAQKNILGSAAKAVKEFLQKNGASFFADIVRGTNLLKSEVENALWELVTIGIATADGFDNLRALIDPKRRAGLGRHGKHARPRFSNGRWSLLHTYQLEERDKIIEATCRVLLNRYGVVFRDLIIRESLPFKWRELLQVFRILEARGEIYGGMFVRGFFGEQFALSNALESLRLFRHRNATAKPILLSATDPLNLQGIILPGEKISAASGKLVIIGSP
jgi:ATP-dependent Lhr-like helicase